MHRPAESSSQAAIESPMSIVNDATCLACGCLCDDIALRVEGSRIVGARNACETGRAWFLSDHGDGGLPVATIDGKAASPAEAIARAAEILAVAKCPVILGQPMTTLEAQASSVALTDRIKGSIEVALSDDATRRIAAVARVGRVSATLGEVKNRADVVVFWGVDPAATHPRHWERYSVEPKGRFIPSGRAGRTVLVADSTRTATGERADHFLAFRPEREVEILRSLQALAAGIRLDAERVGRATGSHLADLDGWVTAMRRARYGAFFLDDRLAREGGPAAVEAALALVRDLNASSRFVALPLGNPGNPAGWEAVLAWQTGFATGIDFSLGYPRPFPEGSSTGDLLATGAADALVIVGDRLADQVSLDEHDRLADLPRILIAPDATRPDRPSNVGLASATTGIHTSGTVLRCDGVTLPLRAALPTTWPTEQEWLDAILARMNELHTSP